MAKKHTLPLDSRQLGEAIRAFMSEKCPACGVDKDLLRDAFCDKCLAKLPQDMRDKVNEKETFLESFHPALEIIRESTSTAAQKPRRTRRRPSQLI